jgi:hypothetical protein
MQLHRPAPGDGASDVRRDGDVCCSEKISRPETETRPGPHPVVQRPDTFPREFLSTLKDPTRVRAPIANQTRGHDQGDTEHFVRRLRARHPFPIARPACCPTRRGCKQPRRAASSPHSHSTINEASKLLIRNMLTTASQTFAVTLAAKVWSTSIGAGFRAVRRRRTLRYLSTSIESRDCR